MTQNDLKEITEWLYLNDGGYPDKLAWRKALSQKLNSLTVSKKSRSRANPYPWHIRLTFWLHFWFKKYTIRQIYKRVGGRCSYCGRIYERLTMDHIVPVSTNSGLQESLNNILPACNVCNVTKGSMTMEEFRCATVGKDNFFFFESGQCTTIKASKPPAEPDNHTRSQLKRLGLIK